MNNKLIRSLAALLMIIGAVLLGGCSSTNIEVVTYKQISYKDFTCKSMVVMVMPNDSILQVIDKKPIRDLEKKICADLRKRNVVVVEGREVFPVIGVYSSEDIAKRLSNVKVDAVCTINFDSIKRVDDVSNYNWSNSIEMTIYGRVAVNQLQRYIANPLISDSLVWGGDIDMKGSASYTNWTDSSSKSSLIDALSGGFANEIPKISAAIISKMVEQGVI